MTAGLLISVVVIFLSLEKMFQKSYNNNTNLKKLSIYSFNLITIVAALVVFLLMPKSENKMTADICIYSAGFAVSYFCALYFQLKAIGEGSLSLSSLIISFSLIIPTFYGVFFLKEDLGLTKIIGFVLLLISLYFVGDVKKTGAITKKWIVFIVLSFLGNGLCSVVQKMYQLKSNGDFKAEFMIIALLMIVVALLATVFFKEKKLPVPTVKNGGLTAVCVGVANAGVNMLVMILAKYPAAIVFPTIQSGSIVAAYIISRFMYKEKLSVNQNIGFCIGVASVILLNM